jgi:hypothetical protein
MIKVFAYCLISGRAFSPTLAKQKTGLSFSEMHSVGDIGTLGKYKHKPFDFGFARLDDDLSTVDVTSFSKCALVKDLLLHLDALRDCGAEQIVLHYDVAYLDQCNIELHSEDLKILSSTGIDVTFTCYRISSQDSATDAAAPHSERALSP